MSDSDDKPGNQAERLKDDAANPPVKLVTVTAANGEDMTAMVQGFARFIGLEQAAPGRYSMLLVLGLFGGYQSGMLNPAKVVHEIHALEGIGPPSKLKPPIQNKHPPLKGLWHKHYLEDGPRAMALNILKGLKRYSIPVFQQRIDAAKAAGEERYVMPEDIEAIATDAVHGNWMRLAAAEALTGEWIVYAKYEGQNYYLALATHDSSTHDQVRQQIDALCCQEFPFLADLLANA
ncbi:hypothetical protein [Paraburkholderia fungorum]|jgi:hypothetical protein|uniref:hypothetical protein n=1 Tax=Paraburkholderia fungorum TaxID=134537 RepID=UPI000418C10F|nr:hypothetical protein [Paraburkholderia fungorum]